MKGGSGDKFFTIDYLLLVYSCIHSKFQNRSTFPSGRKVMTVQERKKEEKKEKLTYENNDHLSFPVTRLPKPTLVLMYRKRHQLA